MLRITLAAILIGATSFAAPAAPRTDRATMEIERRLAKLVPGQPQACITPSRSGGGSHSGNLVLVEGQSGIVYASHFQGGCEADERDTLISRRPTSRLCRGDVVEVTDLVSGAFRGSCMYSDFTPYRRVDRPRD